ncbi:MAG: hypothetical protein CVU64_05040 [Deltaproteobacteria bacterium HGW-Deltaproteobacteria-21]|nr:MAG: hypothetical protein CVU64_05040 [Deltaproteobacteria bacterium HGW-Deltaproteobacteria-21]
MGNGSKERQEEWTASVAVGERSFVERVKALLVFRAKGKMSLKGMDVICFERELETISTPKKRGI